MAGKSFLSRLGRNKNKYKVNKHSASSASTSNSSHMEGKYRQTSSSSGTEPPTKKRKTEDEGDDGDMEEGLWDDSMEFTQADLDDLEIQASQAYTEPGNQGHGEMSASALNLATATGNAAIQGRDSTGMFLKPSRTSSSSTSSLNCGHLSSHSNTSHNSSSHSNQSHHTAHSSYPSSLSDYGTTSSSSIRSGSSIESRRLSTSLSREMSADSLDLTGILNKNQTRYQSASEEVNPYKQECNSLKLQLEKMKEEVCIKDGENKLLRDNLSKKDSELGTLKVEKIKQINQQNKQQSEKQKSLQNEVVKLQTQLQFKSQEERELGNRCRELELQLKTLQTGVPASQIQSHTQATSPKPRRVPVEERSPKAADRSPVGQSMFPTKKTFMAPEVSPKKQVTPSERGDNKANSEPASSSCAVRQKLNRRKHSLVLKTAATRHNMSGSELVTRLIDVTPTIEGNISDRGIVGLLNTPSASTSLCNVQFDRDRDTSLLSPVRNRRLSDFRYLISQQDQQKSTCLVSADNVNMAVQGLTNLLKANHSSDWSELNNKRASGAISTQIQREQVEQTHGNLSHDQKCKRNSNLDNAILVLPLLGDYLRHYIEMLDLAVESSVNTSSGTNSSSSLSAESYETSLESSTGSLGLLLKSTASYANDLESLTLAALKTLHILVACSGVRRTLLLSDSNAYAEVATSSSSEASRSETDESGHQLTMVPHIPLKSILKRHLLAKVIRLSNPGSKGQLYNNSVVQVCLKILGVLATHTEDHQIGNLMCILSEDSLQKCLECVKEPRIVLLALILFKALVKSNMVVSSLCTNTTGCVLMSVYSLCSIGKDFEFMPDIKLQIYQMIIESISYIGSNHKGGMTILLESDCQCSVEVVKNIVCLLHTVMKLYVKENESIDSKDNQTTQNGLNQHNLQRHSLEILQAGLQLLHLMSQHDSAFVNRHIPVQHQYVKLICGLTHIFKQASIENNDSEMAALQDLWDFNQDDSELSQDSDSEDNEDMDAS